jgi:hypothetical protein
MKCDANESSLEPLLHCATSQREKGASLKPQSEQTDLRHRDDSRLEVPPSRKGARVCSAIGAVMVIVRCGVSE